MTPEVAAGIDLAVFILAAFALAGVAQTAWLTSWAMPSLATPIDRGSTFRGHRVFGDHKTLRGFVVMIPATGVAFALLQAVARAAGVDAALWPGGAPGYFLLGLAAGAGFMAGELPNSFIKRQLGIAPGAPALGPISRWLCPITDRLDSVAGALLVLTAIAGVPLVTWIALGIGGPVVHGIFSAVIVQLGGKGRAVERRAAPALRQPEVPEAPQVIER